MMGISWTEFMVIVAVALVVIGPKDLPAAIRTLSHGLRTIRRMAADFQGQVDELIRDSEMDSARREVEEAIREAEKVEPNSDSGHTQEVSPTVSPTPSHGETLKTQIGT